MSWQALACVLHLPAGEQSDEFTIVKTIQQEHAKLMARRESIP